MEINFHHEDIDFPTIDAHQLSLWLQRVAEMGGRTIDELNYIFCSDEYLLKMNKEYLQHDYYTDIITFDYSGETLSGDIYISLTRVSDNAREYKESYQRELHRVIVHGLLHLCGYADKTDSESKLMRQKEEAALSLL